MHVDRWVLIATTVILDCELFLTGLTDSMRADFKIMKEVSNYTRVSPTNRKAAMANFVSRVMADPSAKQMLENWGLKLSADPIVLEARVLTPEKIVFGRNYSEMVGPKADWGRSATSKTVTNLVAC